MILPSPTAYAEPRSRAPPPAAPPHGNGCPCRRSPLARRLWEPCKLHFTLAYPWQQLVGRGKDHSATLASRHCKIYLWLFKTLDSYYTTVSIQGTTLDARRTHLMEITRR